MTTRKRIMHVVHSLNLGGAERLAGQIAVAMSSDYEVTVACLDEAGLWASEIRQAGVSVIELGRQPGLDLSLVGRLAWLARREQVHLLHAHQYSPYFYAALSRALRPEHLLLFHEHGRHYPEVDKRLRQLVNRQLLQRWTTHMVAVSGDVRERLVRYEGLSREKIEVIYNGTDAPPPPTPEGRALLRRELGLASDDLVAGTVGRLDPVKNLPLALAALARLRERFPRLKLVIIGDGPARPALEQTVARLQLQEAVQFTGYRDDAAALVGAMDLFLLPSLTEGTSLALVSAMAAAVPAVATAVGGTPEVLTDGTTGRLVPSEDEAALTEAMAELLDQPQRARQLGQAAREAYLERFTFTGMISRLSELYGELLH